MVREQRRADRPALSARVRTTVLALGRRGMVVGPISAPMAVAWASQTSYAMGAFGWPLLPAVGFAAAFELTTAFTGWMYHQARAQGDAGTVYRLSTWTFAVGAAAMNYAHHCGPGGAPTQAAVAFATMSIVGMILWELYAALLHRRHSRAAGRVAAPRPRIGILRWLRYPAHAWAAWSLTITDGSLTTLDRAWAAAGEALADRRAVRTGTAVHRLVVPRVRTADHGPASIPAVHTVTRMDRPGPVGPRGPVRPADRPDRSAWPVGRTAGPATALPYGPDRTSDAPPDRTAPAADRAPAPAGPATTAGGPARTAALDRTDRTGRTALVVRADRPGPHGPAGPDRPDRRPGPDRPTGPDSLTLTPTERAAVNRLRSTGDAVTKRAVATEVRRSGGSISTDRAGHIVAHLKATST